MKLWLTYLLGGVCLGLGFFLNLHWLLGIIGVFVFLLALEKTDRLVTMVFGSYLTWFTSLAFSVSIFWSVYPIEWIDLGLGKTEILVVGGQWLVTAVFLGTGGLVFGLTYWFARQYLTEKMLFVLFPILWVLAEVSQSFIYSIFVLGPSVDTNVSNSVGYLGYLISDHHLLLPLAKFGGVYVLSALGAWLGFGLWFLMKHYPWRRFVQVSLGLTGILFVSQIIYQSVAPVETESGLGKTVAIVDTTFAGKDSSPLEDPWTYRREQINEAIDVAIAAKADYIILPEDSRLTPLGQTGDFVYKKFRFIKGDPEAVVIDTAKAVAATGENVLRTYIYDGQAKRVWGADKQYLAPIGEYLPYSYEFILSGIGLKEQVNKMNASLSYRVGPLVSQAEFPEYVPGVLFCFEALDPNKIRSLLKQRPVPFVAHPISHAWFHDSELLRTHIDMMLKIQAVWSGVPIISAGNMAEGMVYTKRGVVIKPEITFSGESWRVKLVSL